MFKQLVNHLLMGCFWILFMPGYGLANAQDSNWRIWLQDQIDQHPEITAAHRAVQSAAATARGQGQPLYNPELETEYERNGPSNNFRAGLNQTIDLWDKRGIRSQQGSYAQQVAEYNYQLLRQQRTAEALQTLIAYQASFDLAGFAEKQERQMNTMLDLVQQRQQAGDMGQADTELAFMSLTQQLNVTAEAHAQLKQLRAEMTEILPQWSEKDGKIPASFWEIKVTELTIEDLDLLPEVAAAKALYNVIEQEAKLTRLASKVEPTIGMNGGVDGGEGVVAFSLSFPLNVRNNFDDVKKAASLEAISARHNYRAVKRQYHFSSQAAFGVLQEYRNYYRKWQGLMAGRSETGSILLAQQWESGDLNTTEYLLALGQITEGMIAGIELRSQYQLACVNWLLLSGKLTTQTTKLQ